jgi:hypothetical protein
MPYGKKKANPKPKAKLVRTTRRTSTLPFISGSLEDQFKELSTYSRHLVVDALQDIGPPALVSHTSSTQSLNAPLSLPPREPGYSTRTIADQHAASFPYLAASPQLLYPPLPVVDPQAQHQPQFVVPHVELIAPPDQDSFSSIEVIEHEASDPQQLDGPPVINKPTNDGATRSSSRSSGTSYDPHDTTAISRGQAETSVHETPPGPPRYHSTPRATNSATRSSTKRTPQQGKAKTSVPDATLVGQQENKSSPKAAQQAETSGEQDDSQSHPIGQPVIGQVDITSERERELLCDLSQYEPDSPNTSDAETASEGHGMTFFLPWLKDPHWQDPNKRKPLEPEQRVSIAFPFHCQELHEQLVRQISIIATDCENFLTHWSTSSRAAHAYQSLQEHEHIQTLIQYFTEHNFDLSDFPYTQHFIAEYLRNTPFNDLLTVGHRPYNTHFGKLTACYTSSDPQITSLLAHVTQIVRQSNLSVRLRYFYILHKIDDLQHRITILSELPNVLLPTRLRHILYNCAQLRVKYERKLLKYVRYIQENWRARTFDPTNPHFANFTLKCSAATPKRLDSRPEDVKYDETEDEALNRDPELLQKLLEPWEPEPDEAEERSWSQFYDQLLEDDDWSQEDNEHKVAASQPHMGPADKATGPSKSSTKTDDSVKRRLAFSLSPVKYQPKTLDPAKLKRKIVSLAPDIISTPIDSTKRAVTKPISTDTLPSESVSFPVGAPIPEPPQVERLQCPVNPGSTCPSCPFHRPPSASTATRANTASDDSITLAIPPEIEQKLQDDIKKSQTLVQQLALDCDRIQQRVRTEHAAYLRGLQASGYSDQPPAYSSPPRKIPKKEESKPESPEELHTSQWEEVIEPEEEEYVDQNLVHEHSFHYESDGEAEPVPLKMPPRRQPNRGRRGAHVAPGPGARVAGGLAGMANPVNPPVVNVPAGRGQRADPALIQILGNINQTMQMTAQNIQQQQQQPPAPRQPSEKDKTTMLPVGKFSGKDRATTCTHWSEFEKYVSFQNQFGSIKTFPHLKTMFGMTLVDQAATWFDTTQASYLTMPQLKSAFIKRFSPWGSTEKEQTDSWTRLMFDGTKHTEEEFANEVQLLGDILKYDQNHQLEHFKQCFDANVQMSLLQVPTFPQAIDVARRVRIMFGKTQVPTATAQPTPATVLSHMSSNYAHLAVTGKPDSDNDNDELDGSETESKNIEDKQSRNRGRMRGRKPQPSGNDNKIQQEGKKPPDDKSFSRGRRGGRGWNTRGRGTFNNTNPANANKVPQGNTKPNETQAGTQPAYYTPRPYNTFFRGRGRGYRPFYRGSFRGRGYRQPYSQPFYGYQYQPRYQYPQSTSHAPMLQNTPGAEQTQQEGQTNVSEYRCSVCGNAGHYEQDCKKAQEQYAHLAGLFNNMTLEQQAQSQYTPEQQGFQW